MGLTGDQVISRGIKNGWQGVILNACVRDCQNLKELPIGVKALFTHPGKRIRRGDGKRNVQLNFKGVTFLTGDYIFCDENGIVVLPRNIAILQVENIHSLHKKS